MDEALISRLEAGRLDGKELVANPASRDTIGGRRMPVRGAVSHIEPLRPKGSPVDRSSVMHRLFDSNEFRLDRLIRRGRPIHVDGKALLLFVFDRSLHERDANRARLTWARDVAKLIDEFEQESSEDLCA
jgi:hypothetical protein